MYTAIPELLRSRSARHDLSGLECGPLLGRGCAAVLSYDFVVVPWFRGNGWHAEEPQGIWK